MQVAWIPEARRIAVDERETLLSLVAGVESRIESLDRERTNLLAARDAYQARLAHLEQRETRTSQPATRKLNSRTRSTADRQGAIGLMAAVLQVIRDADGAELHAREILAQAQARGARTNAKDPVGVVDLVATALRQRGRPIEKVGPRAWRWRSAAVPGLFEHDDRSE